LPAYEIPGPIEIGDMNNDGKNEIVSLHSGFQKASIYFQNTLEVDSNFLLFNSLYISNIPCGALTLSDLNNDGFKDIAIAGGLYGLIILYNDFNHISVNENNLFEIISLYPNPSPGKIFFTSSKIESLRIDVFDEKSEFITSLKTEKLNHSELDLSFLKNGIYFLKIYCGKFQYYKRVIILR
jgi:hypothetical protein